MTDAPQDLGNEKIEKSEREGRPTDKKTLDRVADRAAKRAEETEKRYDENHGAFKKYGGG